MYELNFIENSRIFVNQFVRLRRFTRLRWSIHLRSLNHLVATCNQRMKVAVLKMKNYFCSTLSTGYFHC